MTLLKKKKRRCVTSSPRSLFLKLFRLCELLSRRVNSEHSVAPFFFFVCSNGVATVNSVRETEARVALQTRGKRGRNGVEVW